MPAGEAAAPRMRSRPANRQPTVEVVSIHAPVGDISISERVVSMTDAERILLAATIKNTETKGLLAASGRARADFWHTRLGTVSIIIAIVTSLILALGTVYEVFVGLSHSILSSHGL